MLQAGEADPLLASRMDALQAKLEALEPEKHYVEATPVVAAPRTTGDVVRA